MTTRKYSSRSQQTTLAAGITDTATSCTVVSGSALLGGATVPSGTTFTVVIDPDTALEEIVDVTVVSTNVLTITRGVENAGTGQAHSAGAAVRHMAIGRDFREANLHIEATGGYNDGTGAHAMHGIAAGEGDVVGTLKAQTLTQKTLTAPIITNPSITGAGVDASIIFEGAVADAHETTLTVAEPTQDNTITLPNTSGTVVIANAVQTLTNKTMGDALNAGGFKITNLATPTLDSDAVRKDFADAQVAAAATSAASASTSASSAATSASSALTSANSASASATAAATSAASAATSASTMAASVTAAASSATQAATSATSAAASATAAATSASSASTSATAAATSAASASTSASSALTSANSATTSASSALTSQTAAATSATSAAASVTAAATSATSAAASATAAATSATSASASATAAATSATSAAASATASASSATAASSSAVVAASYASAAPEFRQYGAEGSVLQNIPTRVHDAENLLKQAVWWIDSAHSGSSGQAIQNLGWGGAALNATAGSTTSADSNDPKYLPWDGTNYVYQPGTVINNNLSIPDSATLDITGDIDIRAQVALDDWTPTGGQVIVTKDDITGALARTQASYNLVVNASGTLGFQWFTDGTTVSRIIKDSTVAPTVTDGAPLWIRATLDVDNGASGNDVKFFTSNDGITWTQLGTTVTTAGVTSIYAGTTEVRIGQVGTYGSELLAGKIYRAQILNGIDGVPVLDVDTSVIASGSATSFTALTGQTVTINRSTAGRKTTVVTHPVWLFGTDDYMEVNNRWLERTTANYLYLPGVASNYASTPDSAALSITGDIDLRAKIALDDYTSVNNQGIVGKWSGGNRSYFLQVNSDGTLAFRFSADGSTLITRNSTVATGITDGTVKWIRATLDVDNGASGNDVKFFLSDDGTNWTQLGTTITTAGTTSIFDGAAGLEIGSTDGGGSIPARGKFFRAQVYNGIAGTLAFDANFETGITTNLPTTFTESSVNAATVTVNYSGTGFRSAGVIASTYVFPGNPNTFKLSAYSMLDFGASDSMSIIIVNKKFATPANFGTTVAKIDSNRGYRFQSNGTALSDYMQFGDGTNIIYPATGTYTAGSLLVEGFIADRTANTAVSIINGTYGSSLSSTSVGSTANIGTLQIGRAATGAGIIDMEFVSAAVFRKALTAGEIATLNSYFQGRVA